MKTGRKPSLRITKELLAEVEGMASRGLTLSQICSALGVSESTFYRKKRQDKRFRDSVKKGQSRGILKVANNLFQMATRDENPSIPAMIFYLKTRAGWIEHSPLETRGDELTEISFVVAKKPKNETGN